MTGPASPQFFGRYQVTARLGQGGMAQVYRAYDPQLDREVAVKVIGGNLRGDPTFAERFRREARAVAALRHPHIVQVYDFGEDPQGYYMVMEYVPGPSLAEQLAALRDAGQRLPLAETLAILAQVADALDYAHDRGVVHRDVKPGNVLLRDGNSAGVVLADFGLALLRDRVTEATEGRSFGTPEYISPEQAMNSAAATPQSDIYSLGVMAYVMLTGNLPFTGDSPLAVAMAHVNTAPRRLRDLAPDVPPGVETAVLQALAKNPAHRYRTAGAFVGAVRDALLRPSSAAPTRAVQPILPTAQYTTPLNMVWPDAGREADGPPPTRAGMPAAVAAVPEAFPAPARRGLTWGWGLALLVLALCACGLAGGYLIASQLAGGLPGLPAIPAPPTRATALTAAPTAVTPTASATLAPSSTVEPSATPTDTPTATETPTATGTPTATPTPTLTPSATPTPTAQQMIFSLKDAIDLARQQGRIKNPVARDLQERLDGVLEKLNEGQLQEALDRLQAFRDYIGEQGSERRIPEDLVVAWQAQVDLIAAAIRALGG